VLCCNASGCFFFLLSSDSSSLTCEQRQQPSHRQVTTEASPTRKTDRRKRGSCIRTRSGYGETRGREGGRGSVARTRALDFWPGVVRADRNHSLLVPSQRCQHHEMGFERAVAFLRYALRLTDVCVCAREWRCGRGLISSQALSPLSPRRALREREADVSNQHARMYGHRSTPCATMPAKPTRLAPLIGLAVFFVFHGLATRERRCDRGQGCPQ
jgi:hypothetical protein